jgi:hypothetical protein
MQDDGPLVDVGIQAGLAQGEGGGQAAEPGADNEDTHGPSCSATRACAPLRGGSVPAL